MKGIDWQKDMKDTMWSMFWMQQNHGDGDTEADKEALKEAVARLIRMSTQKTTGNYLKKDGFSFDSFDLTIMTIVCAATSLCLHGEFGDMPERIEGEPI